MGPRHFCRGNYRIAVSPPYKTLRFNGATAFLPWKSRRSDSLAPNSARFNGATAFLPWKYIWIKIYSPQQRLLQWGHGISAVEMVLTDIAVLLHVLAHNASASVNAPQWIHVVQPTQPPFFKQPNQIQTVTLSRALPVLRPA